jgi:Na+-translocating ferredoxin:NAD+ oxidoreductase subunit B
MVGFHTLLRSFESASIMAHGLRIAIGEIGDNALFTSCSAQTATPARSRLLRKARVPPASFDAVTVTDSRTLADQIEDLLPQTQCTRCGYPACRPYAEAVAQGAAGYNQCPPGGAEGIARLAARLGKPVIPLNPANGVERPRPVAMIDENLCIGCTLCMQACPVDAIVGAAKQMHTVVAQLCTGCDLCVAPCPVDCIAMVPRTSLADAPDAPLPADNRERFLAHGARAAARASERAALLHSRKQAVAPAADASAR